MKLYDYYRSTACYRVRIGLAIKGIEYETISVNLKEGEQQEDSYIKINPQGLVPCLDINGRTITQSLAILAYLEDIHPEPHIFPQDPSIRANVRSVAMTIGCDIHPLNNLRVLNRLKEQFKAKEEDINLWMHHWLKEGFDALEQKLQGMRRSKSVCCGGEPTVADICLVPQVYSAKRFNFAMDDYPLINEINDYCTSLEAFKKAAP